MIGCVGRFNPVFDGRAGGHIEFERDGHIGCFERTLGRGLAGRPRHYPFAGLSLATPFASDVLKAKLLFALMAYGAIILSFLGGIHWGLAIGAFPQNHNTLWRRIALSILPSLVAWAALLTPSSIGFLVLSAAFVCDTVGGHPGLAHARSPGLVSEA